MEIKDKLSVLARAAKYDVSCSSSGSNRKGKKNELGSTSKGGICHSWTEDGRCVSLLKILFTNRCIYDCLYCENGASNDVPRASFTPDEVAKLTEEFYRRNYIEGLFLSSAIMKSENYTMELLVKTVEKLRKEYLFKGYIHLKGIPGADPLLITRAGKLVDRLSLNVELPTYNSLKALAPDKDSKAIISSMKVLKKNIQETPSFLPAGQTTQLIVGASNDTDKDILSLSENLYKKLDLKRVYYSAFIPVNNKYEEKLPIISSPPYLREHRLYQADWLLRFYKFSHGELFSNKRGNLSLEFDPKIDYALNNFELFPIEINKANREMLLRVPGIGPKSANKIIKARKHSSLGFDDLKRMGIVLKRAKYFITCRGKYQGGVAFKPDIIKNRLISYKSYQQLSLWESGDK